MLLGATIGPRGKGVRIRPHGLIARFDPVVEADQRVVDELGVITVDIQCQPDGAVLKVRLTFVGKIADRLVFNPSASVTVSMIRYLVLPLKSCPVVGIEGATRAGGRRTGVDMTFVQEVDVPEVEFGDKTPSSVAVALKDTTSPATKKPPSGVVLKVVITGGRRR